MSFILPAALLFIVHGALFDLTDYAFKGTGVYDEGTIEPYVQVNRINELVAEYRLLETEAEFREFLGVDVATNLKLLVNKYDYSFSENLKRNIEPDSNKVQIAIKVVLKTVNKTVPFNAPQRSGWEINEKGLLFTPIPIKHDKTHYVKSMVYGYAGFQVIYVMARDSRHKAILTEALLSSVGRAGTLDDTFRGKFWEALEDNYATSYGNLASFGVFPPDIDRGWGIEDMISFKGKLENMTTFTSYYHPGDVLYYELQPLSLISSSFPLVEINSDIFNQLEDIEKKYEDVRIAIREVIKFSISSNSFNLTDEQKYEIDDFVDGLVRVEQNMEVAIRNLDISTSGSVDQLSEIIKSYGITNDTHKYREEVKRFRQQFSSGKYSTAVVTM